MSLFDEYNSSDSDNDADYVPECFSDDELPDVHEENDTKKSSKKALSREVTSADAKEPETKVDEKKRSDDLFKDFLAECANEMKQREEESIPLTKLVPTSSSAASLSLPAEVGTKISNDLPLSEISTKDEDSKINSVEEFDFAGETVYAKKDGSLSVLIEQPIASSSEKPSVPSTENPAVKRPVKKGLESILGRIQNKKPKLSVLDKSLMDWKHYTKIEGIEEDLKQHNQGKGGYIERQRFLQRSDLRSYEIERDMRLSKKKPT